jgi:signal peptidase II
MKLVNNFKMILFFSALIFLDQLSKYLIRSQGGFYICNKNMAWGIEVPDILVVLTTIVLVIVSICILNKKYFIHNTSYIILITAGAVSNMIDRIYFGCVVDFIDLKFWPVFNPADTFISIGALILLVKYWKS